MRHFADQYDDLIDLLCCSAQAGVDAATESQYTALRAWFLEHYDASRPLLLEYLEEDPQDIAPHAPEAPAPRDAFESLFLPTEIHVLLFSPSLIDRITRTREAVEQCRHRVRVVRV